MVFFFRKSGGSVVMCNFFTCLPMKMMRFFCVFLIFAPILVSCDYKTLDELLQGKWNLVSIESRINGEQSVDPMSPDVSEVCYVFRADSTYVLNELDRTEEGRWRVEGDSMLVTEAESCNNDTSNLVYLNIRCLDDSIMMLHNVVDTDYGVVEETYVYKKELGM